MAGTVPTGKYELVCLPLRMLNDAASSARAILLRLKCGERLVTDNESTRRRKNEKLDANTVDCCCRIIVGIFNGLCDYGYQGPQLR